MSSRTSSPSTCSSSSSITPFESVSSSVLSPEYVYHSSLHSPFTSTSSLHHPTHLYRKLFPLLYDALLWQACAVIVTLWKFSNNESAPSSSAPFQSRKRSDSLDRFYSIPPSHPLMMAVSEGRSSCDVCASWFHQFHDRLLAATVPSEIRSLATVFISSPAFTSAKSLLFLSPSVCTTVLREVLDVHEPSIALKVMSEALEKLPLPVLLTALHLLKGCQRLLLWFSFRHPSFSPLVSTPALSPLSREGQNRSPSPLSSSTTSSLSSSSSTSACSISDCIALVQHLTSAHTDWCHAMVLGLTKWMLERKKDAHLLLGQPPLPSQEGWLTTALCMQCPALSPASPVAASWSCSGNSHRMEPFVVPKGPEGPPDARVGMPPPACTVPLLPGAGPPLVHVAPLLSHIAPFFASASISFASGEPANVQRGDALSASSTVPHPWCQETLLEWMFAVLREHHAVMWSHWHRRQGCWVQWRGKKGMRLLQRFVQQVAEEEEEEGEARGWGSGDTTTGPFSFLSQKGIPLHSPHCATPPSPPRMALSPSLSGGASPVVAFETREEPFFGPSGVSSCATPVALRSASRLSSKVPTRSSSTPPPPLRTPSPVVVHTERTPSLSYVKEGQDVPVFSSTDVLHQCARYLKRHERKERRHEKKRKKDEKPTRETEHQKKKKGRAAHHTSLPAKEREAACACEVVNAQEPLHHDRPPTTPKANSEFQRHRSPLCTSTPPEVEKDATEERAGRQMVKTEPSERGMALSSRAAAHCDGSGEEACGTEAVVRDLPHTPHPQPHRAVVQAYFRRWVAWWEETQHRHAALLCVAVAYHAHRHAKQVFSWWCTQQKRQTAKRTMEEDGMTQTLQRYHTQQRCAVVFRKWREKQNVQCWRREHSLRPRFQRWRRAVQWKEWKRKALTHPVGSLCFPFLWRMASSCCCFSSSSSSPDTSPCLLPPLPWSNGRTHAVRNSHLLHATTTTSASPPPPLPLHDTPWNGYFYFWRLRLWERVADRFHRVTVLTHMARQFARRGRECAHIQQSRRLAAQHTRGQYWHRWRHRFHHRCAVRYAHALHCHLQRRHVWRLWQCRLSTRQHATRREEAMLWAAVCGTCPTTPTAAFSEVRASLAPLTPHARWTLQHCWRVWSTRQAERRNVAAVRHCRLVRWWRRWRGQQRMARRRTTEEEAKAVAFWDQHAVQHCWDHWRLRKYARTQRKQAIGRQADVALAEAFDAAATLTRSFFVWWCHRTTRRARRARGAKEDGRWWRSDPNVVWDDDILPSASSSSGGGRGESRSAIPCEKPGILALLRWKAQHLDHAEEESNGAAECSAVQPCFQTSHDTRSRRYERETRPPRVHPVVRRASSFSSASLLASRGVQSKALFLRSQLASYCLSQSPPYPSLLLPPPLSASPLDPFPSSLSTFPPSPLRAVPERTMEGLRQASEQDLFSASFPIPDSHAVRLSRPVSSRTMTQAHTPLHRPVTEVPYEVESALEPYVPPKRRRKRFYALPSETCSSDPMSHDRHSRTPARTFADVMQFPSPSSSRITPSSSLSPSLKMGLFSP